MIIPRSEYRDLFYVQHFGPFDAADFVSSGGQEDGNLSSFIFSHLSSSPFSSSTSDYSSDVVSTEQTDLITTQEETTSAHAFAHNALVNTAQGVFSFSSAFMPDKDTWVDAAWCRVEERATTFDSPLLRLLSVSDKQNVRQAWLNDQFITDPLNVGDTASSFDSFSSDVLTPMPLSTKVDFAIRQRGKYNSRTWNLIPAGGMLIIASSLTPTGMRDLRVSIRCRERRL